MSKINNHHITWDPRPLNPDFFSKTKWRDILLAHRRQLSSQDQKRSAENATTLLIDTTLFQQSKKIACYYPINHEFDCLPIIHAIWQAKKQCYLPILSSTKPSCLQFLEYRKNSVLQPNRYQILEPVNEEKISVDNLDLVLLPLLGFDREGNRLGMGAGYYDRTFQEFKKNQKPFLLGLGYEAQCVSKISPDAWDIPLNGVLTEKRILFFPKP